MEVGAAWNQCGGGVARNQCGGGAAQNQCGGGAAWNQCGGGVAWNQRGVGLPGTVGAGLPGTNVGAGLPGTVLVEWGPWSKPSWITPFHVNCWWGWFLFCDRYWCLLRLSSLGSQAEWLEVSCNRDWWRSHAICLWKCQQKWALWQDNWYGFYTCVLLNKSYTSQHVHMHTISQKRILRSEWQNIALPFIREMWFIEFLFIGF